MQFEFYLLTNEPTHIVEKAYSCTDLNFTFHSNLALESGVFSPLHHDCHHPVVHIKISPKIYHPPLYENEVWNSPKVNTDKIKRAGPSGRMLC